MLAVITLTAAALALAKPAGDARGPGAASQRSAAPTTQDSAHYVKQTSPGRVMLDVWPGWRDTVLVVQIRATTHTVELGTVNLGEQVRLVVAGTEITPVRAGPLTGHHAAAEVVFRLDERPSSFTITIRDVPDVPTRVLTWPPAADGGP